jgi:ribonucleoside-diphosphate reductase alpha chain
MSHRRRLPNRRAREGFCFEHDGIQYTACIGRYDDERVAEIFLSTTKAGSSSDAIARDAAYVASLALQYGCPLESIKSGLLRAPDGQSAGVLGHAIDLIRPAPPRASAPVPPASPPPPPAPGAAIAVKETEDARS